MRHSSLQGDMRLAVAAQRCSKTGTRGSGSSDTSRQAQRSKGLSRNQNSCSLPGCTAHMCCGETGTSVRRT